KVINEPDFLPLHFIRILTQAAKLVRTYRGKLVATPLGRKILNGEQHGPLQAVLFHVAFWRLNLAYFDRYALDTWPQNEVGVVLWSLSASAVNAGEKMHQRAGVKLHHGGMPNARTGRLLLRDKQDE